jgi:hypothetical protein
MAADYIHENAVAKLCGETEERRIDLIQFGAA